MGVVARGLMGQAFCSAQSRSHSSSEGSVWVQLPASISLSSRQKVGWWAGWSWLSPWVLAMPPVVAVVAALLDGSLGLGLRCAESKSEGRGCTRVGSDCARPWVA